MHFDETANKKISGAFLLLNNKFENSYILALSSIKNLLNINDTINISLESITCDFEKSLLNSINKVFVNVRLMGCLFHFVKNIRLNMGKYGLLINEYLEFSENLLKEISKGPFVYYKNNYYFKDLFDEANKNIIDENHKNILTKFIKYFYKNWNIYFENDILNYYSLLKIQRINSYIENYNRRIRSILSKYIIYNYLFFI